MRVLLISVGYRGGGAERCARELFHRLPEAGIDTEIWIPRRREDDPPGVCGMQNAWERYLNFLEAIPHWTDWRHRGAIRSLDSIQPGDFDVVHMHVIHSGCGSIKALQRLSQRIPTVWTFHDEWPVTGGSCYFLGDRISPRDVKRLTSGLFRYVPYHSFHENPRFRGLRRFLERWMPQPRAVICPSQYLLDLAIESGRFPNAEFFLIPNAVQLLESNCTAVDQVASRVAFGLQLDVPTILLIAANVSEPRKGIPLATEAINSLSRDRRVQVLLLGRATGPVERMLHASRVVATYASDDATLIRAYRAADVTLIPSLADNLPYVALESLACETPVVAFRVGGLEQIVGNDQRGRLIDCFDIEAMANATQELLDSPQSRRETGQAGRQWVLEHCRMENYLKAITNVYRVVTHRDEA